MSRARVRCTSCDAVCCRLTVVLGSDDDVPPHLTTRLGGLHVMARDEEGWCVALGRAKDELPHPRQPASHLPCVRDGWPLLQGRP